MSRRAETHFSKGDQVEVTRPEGVLIGPFYAATVLRSPAKDKTHLFVEYHTLLNSDTASAPLKEYVDMARVRPTPPREFIRCFLVGDSVDAYHETGWHRGLVIDIHENSSYLVMLEEKCEEFVFKQFNLRLHRDWDDGSWSPPLPEQESEMKKKLSEAELKTKKITVKIKCSKKMPVTKFRVGEMVEVSSDEEGYLGSWYTATVIDFIDSDKCLVEYLTLTADDETSPLREEADMKYIRPYPPSALTFMRYKLHEEVDAWYNDGWWIGVVSKVLDRNKYYVYFRSTREEMEFTHCNLRPHQDWINGKWVSSKEKSGEFETKPVDVKLKTVVNGRNSESLPFRFSKGMEVEVRSDEAGYQGSWYTAKIVNSVGKDKYLVEYQTLKTEDEAELLKEEASAHDIRPRTPNIQRVGRFEQRDKVDAWYNEGWWLGHISRVLDGWKYMVYFRSTNEVMEVEHRNLRPHLEWTNGQWFDASTV